MKNLLIIIVLLLIGLNGFGQQILYDTELVDSIIISSHLSAYQFDEEGTTKGKEDILNIAYSTEDSSYIIQSYCRNTFQGTIKPNNHEIKTKYWDKYSHLSVDKYHLISLLQSLETNDEPINYLHSLSPFDFKELVNEKSIRNFANFNKQGWHFSMRYTTKENNVEFFKNCQSYDSLKLYLSIRFDTIGYSMITDYSNLICIRIVTNKSNIQFEGKYPNPLKQPWYNYAGTSFAHLKKVLNLNINFSLDELLPKNFLLKDSISKEAFINDYITWYFERRGILN